MQRKSAVQRSVDWFQVCAILTRQGYPLVSVAQHIGVARTTLIGWKQGAEPRHSEGTRLLAFWCQVTGNTLASVPMVSTGDWWAYHSR